MENPYAPSQVVDESEFESGGNGLLVTAISLAVMAGVAFWLGQLFIAMGAAVLLVFVLVCLVSKRELATPRRSWPLISDDEFVAKCGPGVERETALKVRRIASEQLGIDYDRIHPEQILVTDLYCDQ